MQEVLFDKKGRTRAQLGMLSKRKGKAFEREIVNRFKDAGIDCERGWWQSLGGGRVPDVMVEGLWLELGHGGMNPLDKLAQAEAYVKEHVASGRPEVIPVAVVKANGARVIYTTMRLKGMFMLAAPWTEAEPASRELIVTLSLNDFIVLYVASRSKEAPAPGSGFTDTITE